MKKNELYKLIMNKVKSTEFGNLSKYEQNELIDMYEEKYLDTIKITKEEYDEETFIQFVVDQIYEMEEINKRIMEMIEDVSKSNLIKLKICLDNDYSNYRIIAIPSIYSVAEMVYSILAIFDASMIQDYALKQENVEFRPLFAIKDIRNEINAQSILVEEMNLNKDDELYLLYAYNEWVFKIEVIEITPNIEGIEETILIEKHGIDIIEDDIELFEALNKGDLETVKELTEDVGYYEFLEETYKNRNINISINELEDRIENITDMYEFEDSDDEYEEEEEQLISIEEHRKKLEKLPHIKKYQKVKKLYESVIDPVIGFYNTFEKMFEERISKCIKQKTVKMPSAISAISIKLAPTSVSNILITKLLPFIDGYESPIEVLMKNGNYKKEEKQMMEAIIKSKAGLYEIVGTDIENGYVLLKDIKTEKEIEVLDLNLSRSAFIFDEAPFIACRVCTYDSINFMLSGDFVFDCDELQSYIRKYLQFNHNDLDLFINIARIRSNQNDMFND